MKAIKAGKNWYVQMPNKQYTKDESLCRAIIKACVKIGVPE